jgi:hypothetical protein
MAGTGHQHFATEEWVDFVNGTTPAEARRAMQEHLDTSCGTCSEAARLWQRVRQAAQRESEYEVPESALRHVRNAFVVAQTRKENASLEIPRLVFDSMWPLAAVGVRSTLGTRQVIYRSAQIAIEMQLEPVPNSEHINVTGQVSNTARQDEGLAEIPVVISNSKGTVEKTSTNRFGEFHLGFVPDSSLRISFGVVDGKELSIPLDERD